MTPRTNFALTILSIELRNATARQRARLKRMDVQSLAINEILKEAKTSMRKLRYRIGQIEKLEAREKAGKKRNIQDRWAGINRRMSGTYGK